jgi:uncharacterized phage infection (PIP) family protein YhgE
VDANGATKHSVSGTGDRQYSDLYAAARQVTSALNELVDHVKTSPRQQGGGQMHRRTTENYDYEESLRQTTNRLLTQHREQTTTTTGGLEVDTDTRPDHRDKLINAARVVAQATSQMIDATKQSQTREPQEAEAQVALKSIAENLVQMPSLLAKPQRDRPATSPSASHAHKTRRKEEKEYHYHTTILPL